MTLKLSRRRGTVTAAVSAALLLALVGCSEGVVGGSSGGGGGTNGGNGDSNGGGNSAPEVTLTQVTAALAGTSNAAVENWFLAEIEERSNGRIAVERTEAYALCDAPEIAECVSDGRADIGVTIPDYTPDRFPSTSVVSIPFLGQNWQGITRALYELHRNNPDAEAVMTGNNLYHLNTWPVGRMLLGTNEPVDTREGLAGLSTRVSGPLAIQLFESADVNVVTVPAAEAYEGVERGLINSMAAGLDFPVNYQLREVLSHWVDPGIGEYSAFSMWMNLDTYESMPADLQDIINEVAEELASGTGAQQFHEAALEQCDAMLDGSVELMGRWDESIATAWEAEMLETLEASWIDMATGQGLNNAEQVLSDYKAGLEQHADPNVEDATLSCIDRFNAEQS